MTSDLTKIKGVGANSAKLLSEAGFASVESIANATVKELGKVKGFGPATANRVIAAAKEMNAPVEPEIKAEPAPEVKVEPVVVTATVAAAAAETSRFAVLGSAQVLFSMAAILVIAIIIAAYAGLLDKYSDYFPFEITSQESQNSTNAVVTTADQQSNDTGMGPAHSNAEMQHAAMQEQFAAGQRLPAEPEWVTRQRTEAEQYQAEMQRRMANGEPPVEPVWITRQRAEAEEYRNEMQRRQAAGLPPIEPVWITRQRDQANQHRAEMQKRQMQHHQAMMSQRSGVPYQE